MDTQEYFCCRVVSQRAGTSIFTYSGLLPTLAKGILMIILSGELNATGNGTCRSSPK